MKSALTYTKRLPAPPLWFALAVVAVLAVAVSPPFLPEGARSVVMAAYAPLCHQLAERSFALGGVPLALCHRCVGIAGGIVLGLLMGAFPAVRGRLPVLNRFPAVLLAVALVPMVADWALEAAFGVPNTVFSRVTTGLWGGIGLGLLFGAVLLPAGRSGSRQSVEEVRGGA